MVEEIQILRCTDTEEKRKAIYLCGDVFATPVYDRDDFEEYFRKIDRLACFVIAKKRDSICGFSAFYMNDHHSKAAFLSLIAVSPLMQGQNIGAALLQESEKIARENGMERMSLKVRCENVKAIRFYKKQGYTMEISDDIFLQASKEWGDKS